jgi:transcriptional regulator with XRE-family HTH domain
MATKLQDKLNKLSKERQKAIEARTQELICEEMTLRDLRKAMHKTQVELSKSLHIQQDGISRLENRSDMLITTLGKYIKAMGGTLKLTAEFPDRPPVNISGFNELQEK